MLIAAGLLVLGAASCSGNTLDDADSADVIIQVVSLDNPQVTANTSSGSSGTCQITGSFCLIDTDCGIGDSCVIPPAGCTLEVADWTANLANVPKNSLAVGPWNDVVLADVTITYSWLSGEVTPVNVVGLGNVTVPAEETAAVTFQPITNDALQNPSLEGSTANLTLDFRGITVEGTTLRGIVSRQLFVETCTP
jgi:hypothetical protein